MLNSFKSLLGVRKKSTSGVESPVDSIKDAVVGDVFTITGLSIQFEDSYLIIEKKDRYESDTGSWYEALGSDGGNSLWLQWSDADSIQISAMTEDKPVGLSTLGINESDLQRMDDEHSIDNAIVFDDIKFSYQQSREAFHFPNGQGQGEGFYMWEFSSEDQVRLISVIKWENRPFQVYFSEVVPLENVTVYKS